MATATHVFVRRDAVSSPLAPRYDGPFEVLAHTPTFFTLQMDSGPDTVSIDRLRPALMPTHPAAAPTRPRGRPPMLRPALRNRRLIRPRPLLRHVHFTEPPTADHRYAAVVPDPPLPPVNLPTAAVPVSPPATAASSLPAASVSSLRLGGEPCGVT